MRYVYSIIRFTPDAARGEFVNVGIIVGSEDSSEWEVRQIENPVRARQMDDRGTLPAVWEFINGVGAQIDEHQASLDTLLAPEVDLNEEWLWDLHRHHRNLVQLSEPVPMVAASADDAFAKLWNEVLVDPAVRRYSFKKKFEALAAVRRAYQNHAVKKRENFQERVQLQTKTHREGFDFAVVNGKALQLTHTWSFQNPKQDELAEKLKAWGWTVKAAQEEGGMIILPGGRHIPLAAKPEFDVVYVPPEKSQRTSAWREAESIFAELEVRSYTTDQADKVGERADELLRQSRGDRLDLGKKPKRPR